MHPNKVYKLSPRTAQCIPDPLPASALPPPWGVCVGWVAMPAELINPPEGQACPAAHQDLAVARLAGQCPVRRSRASEWKRAWRWRVRLYSGLGLKFGQNSQHPASLSPALHILRPVGGTEGGQAGWAQMFLQVTSSEAAP